MTAKGIAILIVFFIFGLPTLIRLLDFSVKSVAEPGNLDNIAEGTTLIAESAVPWWIGVLSWLAGLRTVGAISIIGFMLFLQWIGK